MAHPTGSERAVSGWRGEDLVPAERRRRAGFVGWVRGGVREAPENIGLGVLIGVSLITVVMLIGQPAGWYTVTYAGLTAQWLPALGWMVLLSVVQELVFRGLLYNALEWLFGSVVAVAVTAAMFGAAFAVVPEASTWSVIAVALQSGVLLGVLYAVTRSLWAVIALSISWGVTEGLVFGAPMAGLALESHPLFRTQVAGDEFWSGGRFGPEAGIFAIVLSGAVAVLLVSWGQGRGRFRSSLWRRSRSAARD